MTREQLRERVREDFRGLDLVGELLADLQGEPGSEAAEGRPEQGLDAERWTAQPLSS